MDTTAPATSAPAPSAPPPSAPASAPSSPAPSSSTPSTPSKYGEIPKTRAQEIFAQIDGAAETKTPLEGETPAEAPIEAIPEAKVPESTAPAAAEPAVVDPTASPNEEALPQRLRDSLKTVQDPGVRKYLADAAHMRATLQKTGLPFEQLNQFIAEAPEYLSKAPTIDVLNEIVSTSEQTQALGSDFMSGSEEGLQRFNHALIQAGPVPYVQNLGFLLNNLDGLIGGLKQNYGEALGRQVEQFRDNIVDGANRNVVARMRQKAAEGGDFEVLSEVADEFEKFIGLKDRAQAKARPNQPDPRDLRIQTLEQQSQQAETARRETFTQGVFSQAGNTIDTKIKGLVDQKGSGFTPEARAELVEAIGTKIYGELLQNKAVLARVNAIQQAGKWDNAHAQQLVNFYVSAADRLIGVVAIPVLRRMAQLTGTNLAARQQKVAAQVARRDPGAAGSPPRPAPITMPKNATPKEIFDFLDKQATAQAGGG